MADKHSQEILLGAKIAFLYKILAAGLNFLFNFLLARFLGIEGSSIYYLAFTIIMFTSIFGRFGMDIILVKNIAAFADKNKWGAVLGIYKTGMIFCCLTSAILTITVYVAAPTLANVVFTSPNLIGPLQYMSFAILPMVLTILHAESLRGLKLIAKSILIQSVLPLIIAILFLYPLTIAFHVNGAVASYTSGVFLATILGVFLWKNFIRDKLIESTHFDTSIIYHSAFPLLWVAILNFLINWMPTFWLGIVGNNHADIGGYNIAFRTALLIGFVLIAFNSIAAPKFSALYHSGQIHSLEKSALNSCRIMSLFSLPIVLIFVFFSNHIMELFGNGFSEYSNVLVILSIGQFINVATGSVGIMLIMTGHESMMKKTLILCTLICTFLCAVLIPKYGAIGAAIASAVTFSLQNLFSAFIVYKKLGIVTIPIIDNLLKKR